MKRVASITKPSPVLQLVWSAADVSAIKSLLSGTADEQQQKIGMEWILNEACGLRQVAYRPGTEGERDTVFMEGRHFVGVAIHEMRRITVTDSRGDGNV